MGEPIRERLLADAAARKLQPLEAYQRLFPGRDADVARAWREASGASTGSSPNLEDATRAAIGLDALRADGSARLKLGESIGSGGMGEVIAARDELLRRDLALKRVRADAVAPDDDDGSGGTGGQPSSLVRRLLEEAQITAQLDHPGVVPVHALGLDADGRPWFTMKRVHGHTLGEMFRREREGKGRSLARTLQVFVRICETLAYAHKKGVVHRDVKPANVMIGRFGEVYLMDWGLAKLRGDAPESKRAAPAPGATAIISTHRSDRQKTGADAALTQHDQVVGTLGYLPPEQLVGGTVDERSDLYAVGAMLYELLAGHAPYCEPEPTADLGRTLGRMMKEPPTPLAKVAPQAPPELVAIAEKALARDPEKRFASALELSEDLHAFLEGRVVRSHKTGLMIELRKWIARNRWLAAGLAGLLLAAAATVTAFVAQQRQAAVDVGRERDRAQDEAQRAQAAGRRAEGLRLAAQSRMLGEDPGLALALAVEAGRRAPGAAANGAIHHALRRHRELRYLAGHETYVARGAWTSDGTRLLTGDENGLVVLWDAPGDAPLRWFEGAVGAVVALVIAPGDAVAAVAHKDGPVRWLDLATGAESVALDVRATSLAFAADGRLIVAGEDGTTETVRRGGGERVVLDKRPGPVWLAQGRGPEDTTLVLTAPGRLVLLDLSGGPAREIEGPPESAEPLAVQSSAAGAVLVRWDARDTRVLALADGTERRRVGTGQTVESAAWSGDGSRLLLGVRPPGGAARVVVQAAADGATLASVTIDASRALLPTRDGRAFVAMDSALATWVELDTRPRLVPLRGHRYTIAHGALSPDEHLLATCSHDTSVRVWALKPENERAALVPRVAAGHRVLGWSQDASRALVALPGPVDAPTALEVVDTASGRVAGRFEAPPGPLRLGGLDVTGGEAWWLVGREWRAADVATGRVVRSCRLAAEPSADTTAFPSPDGRFVAIYGEERLLILDQTTGAKVGQIGTPKQALRPAWAPDGKHLVVAHPPEAFSALYRHDGGEALHRFLGHTGYVTDARSDPLGKWVVSVAADTTVRVYERATGKHVGLHPGLPLRGARIAVGPKGDLVAVLTTKHVLLDLDGAGVLRERATLEREGEEILGLHPDGRRFWIIDEQQRARLWDLDAVADGVRALRRPVLRADGVADYEPDPTNPLDAAWLARPDAWWSLERASRAFAAGRLDDAEAAIASAAAQRPLWAAPDLERVRLAAARASKAGKPAAEVAPELVRGLEAARARGAERLVARGWRSVPAELRPYLGDERLRAALESIGVRRR